MLNNSKLPLKPWEYAIIIAMLGILLFTIIFGVFFNLRVNTNPSIAVGIYNLTHGKLEKNQYISFCPPHDRQVFLMALERGYLRGGYCKIGSLPMMKKIIATNGDKISIMPEGIYINDRIIKDSQPFEKDGKNRPLPQITIKDYTLKDDEILVFGDNDIRSFDSRYFGTIPITQIKGILKPILVF